MFSGVQIANITRNQQGWHWKWVMRCAVAELNFNHLHSFISIVFQSCQEDIHLRASLNCSISDLHRAAIRNMFSAPTGQDGKHAAHNFPCHLNGRSKCPEIILDHQAHSINVSVTEQESVCTSCNASMVPIS